jgi:hypothetical protein
MVSLLQAASVKPNESGFSRLAYGSRLAGFFTTNVTVHLEGLGSDFTSIHNRTEFAAAALAARSQLREARFNLADLNVTLRPETRFASAYVVVTGEINSLTNQFGQAFRMTLRKTGGRWLIAEVKVVEPIQ